MQTQQQAPTKASAASTPEKQAKPTAQQAPLVSESVTSEQVRLCAYQKWELAGRPVCDGTQFWLEAEQQLRRNQ